MRSLEDIKNKIIVLSDYLADVDEDTKWVDSNRMISNFTLLLRLTDMEDQDKNQHNKYKKEIVRLMIERGGYYKSQTNYIPKEAIKMFLAVNKIEPNIPLSHYRLGHLYYADNEYVNSIFHFNQAIRLNNDTSNNNITNYKLDTVQIEHANLFIALNGLKLASEKEDFISNHKGNYVYQIKDLINSTENIYRKNELVKYDPKGNKTYISFEEYLEMTNESDMIIISNIDGNAQIQYMDKNFEIEKSIYIFLKLLTFATLNNPVLGSHVSVRDRLKIDASEDRVDNTLAVRKRYLSRFLQERCVPISIKNGDVAGKRRGYYATYNCDCYFIEREALFSE